MTVFQRARHSLNQLLGRNYPLQTDTRQVTNHRNDTLVVRSTGRWRGVIAVSLCAMALGVLAARPSLLLVAAVGIVFASYPQLTRPPDPTLVVSRELTSDSSTDQELMAVETTVHNDGESRLFDVRIVDGVPDLLTVVDGSPRCATSLAAGESVTLRYRLSLRPGRHRFRPTTVLCRDASGAVEIEAKCTEPTEIETAARLPAVPLAAHHRYQSGMLSTDDRGEGIEFHSVEEYTQGDPVSRIDWRRFGRTKELRSVAYRPERNAEVIICLDTRAVSYRASNRSEPHAVALGVEAAARIADRLFESTHRVGLAGFGRDSCLLSPGAGADHQTEFHRVLSTHSAFELDPPAATEPTKPRDTSNNTTIDRQLTLICDAIGTHTQLFLLTPLCDERSIHIAQRVANTGAALTVISPDTTTTATDGGCIARLERDARLTALRSVGIPTVDWNPSEPLGAALASMGGRQG